MPPIAAIARPTSARIPVVFVSGIEALFRVGIDAAVVIRRRQRRWRWRRRLRALLRLEHPAMPPIAAIARPTSARIPVGFVSGIVAHFRVGIDAAVVRLL